MSQPSSATSSPLRGTLFFEAAPSWTPRNDPTPITAQLDLVTGLQRNIRQRGFSDVSQDGSEFLYSYYEDENDGYALAIGNRSGEIRRILAGLPEYLSNARFSPDGQRIAALVGSRSPARLVTFTRTGADSRVPLDRDISSFEFMPDGRILFVDGDSLFFLDLRADSVSGLAKFAGDHPRNVEPSPDGTRVALELGNPELLQNQVWVFDVSTTTGAPRVARKLTREPGNNGTPAWSPDGRLIAFRNGLLSAGRGIPGSGCPTLWVVDADLPASAVVGVDAAARAIPMHDETGFSRAEACATSHVEWR